jgi:hypothetical protein
MKKRFLWRAVVLAVAVSVFVIACDNDDDKKEEKGVLTISGVPQGTNVATAFVVETGIDGVVDGIANYLDGTGATSLQAYAAALNGSGNIDTTLDTLSGGIQYALIGLIDASGNIRASSTSIVDLLNGNILLPDYEDDGPYTGTHDNVAIGVMTGTTPDKYFGFGKVDIKDGSATITWAGTPAELPQEENPQAPYTTASIPLLKTWLTTNVTASKQIPFADIIGNIIQIKLVALQQ